MKKIIYLLFAVLLVSGCGGSKKQLQKGNYDAAIQKSVKKLMKNPTSEDDIMVLDKSYNIANEQDNERVRLLKMEGNPSNWDEVLNIYSRLKNRQTTVRTVLPLQLGNRSINYPYVDYDAEIVQAKTKASEYLYAHGKNLMENNDKNSYREAYYSFDKVLQYMGDYLDADQLAMEARALGMSRALIMLQNKSVLKFPPEYEQELLAISPADLNSEWVEYHTRHLSDDIEYDYYIYVNMNMINVSPDNLKEEDRMVNKRVEDGWEYVLDANGNVMRDTAGNDVKLPKYKTLSCTLIESHQSKSVQVTGDVEIVQVNPQRVLKKDPIGAESVFEHHSARSVGDINALSDEERALLDMEAVPFPNDFEMVYRGTETLKQAIRSILYNNRRYIQ